MLQLNRKVTYALDMIQRRILMEYRSITQPEMVEIEGIKIAVNQDLPKGPREALYGGYYEKSEIQIIKQQLQWSDRVMEMGAGLGLVSSYCAKKIGSDKVLTYEANPAMEPYIRQNYALNNVDPTLEICLLGEQAGEQTFYVGKSFWSSSIIQRRVDDKEIKVPVKSFNQEVYKFNPTFLIVDIEGGEYEVFKNVDVDFHNIQKIVIELHERVIGLEKVEVVISQFAAAGFQINKKFSASEELFFQRH